MTKLGIIAMILSQYSFCYHDSIIKVVIDDTKSNIYRRSFERTIRYDIAKLPFREQQGL